MVEMWKVKFFLNVALSLIFGVVMAVPSATALAYILASNPLASLIWGMLLGGVLTMVFYCTCFWFLEVRNA